MNLQVWLHRLLGRATCTAEAGARIALSARIVNIAGDSRRIRIGANTFIKGELLVFAHGGDICLGNWCFVGQGTRLWSGISISIGNRVMISHSVNIFDNLTHPLAPTERHAHFRQIVEHGHSKTVDLKDAPVRIEDDAWIGTGSIVLRGVTVGRGAIVGAGSVVTKDVAPMTLVAGNPARTVRELDSIDTNQHTND